MSKSTTAFLSTRWYVLRHRIKIKKWPRLINKRAFKWQKHAQGHAAQATSPLPPWFVCANLSPIQMGTSSPLAAKKQDIINNNRIVHTHTQKQPAWLAVFCTDKGSRHAPGTWFPGRTGLKCALGHTHTHTHGPRTQRFCARYQQLVWAVCGPIIKSGVCAPILITFARFAFPMFASVGAMVCPQNPPYVPPQSL